MRYVLAVVVVAILISKSISVAKTEQQIMLDEIAEQNRVLEESIGDPDTLPWKHHAN